MTRLLSRNVLLATGFLGAQVHLFTALCMLTLRLASPRSRAQIIPATMVNISSKQCISLQLAWYELRYTSKSVFQPYIFISQGNEITNPHQETLKTADRAAPDPRFLRRLRAHAANDCSARNAGTGSER
jgi:hypothetical protein